MDSDCDTGPDLHVIFRDLVLSWREQDCAAHLYVLLDPGQPIAADDPLHPQQPLLCGVWQRMEPVLRPDLRHEPGLLPRLLQLYAAGDHGYADERLLDALLADAAERRLAGGGSFVTGWIWTRAEPGVLARHLASSGVMFDMGLGRERYVPLFEPHRLMLFADADPGAGALDAWLGPIDHWLAIDSRGALRVLTRSAVDDAAGPHRLQSRLGRAASAAQQRVPCARAVLAAMGEAELPLPETPELAVDMALRRASERGLRAHEDIVFSALNDFTLGTGWHRHPAATAAISRVLGDRTRALPCEFLALSDAELAGIAEFGTDDPSEIAATRREHHEH